mmetsp:Transcript_17790/g.38099  ORF Transcript_17790/g.38099 Transcript_17790/m.38099 type:complete len:247 (-) Transcript_17790:647-1387(-)
MDSRLVMDASWTLTCSATGSRPKALQQQQQQPPRQSHRQRLPLQRKAPSKLGPLRTAWRPSLSHPETMKPEQPGQSPKMAKLANPAQPQPPPWALRGLKLEVLLEAHRHHCLRLSLRTLAAAAMEVLAAGAMEVGAAGTTKTQSNQGRGKQPSHRRRCVSSSPTFCSCCNRSAFEDAFCLLHVSTPSARKNAAGRTAATVSAPAMGASSKTQTDPHRQMSRQPSATIENWNPAAGTCPSPRPRSGQ